ncbi:MAG: ester cyclase [Thermoleophilia bacterium]
MDIEAMKRFAVERVEVLFNRGELDRVEEFVTPDFVNHEAWPGEDSGFEGFRLRLQRLREAFPDFHMTVEDVIAEGDTVAYRATISGTHRGALLGMEPTGRSFSGVQHIHFLRMRDGRASEHWASRDDLGMMHQLGLAPVPPLGEG